MIFDSQSDKVLISWLTIFPNLSDIASSLMLSVHYSMFVHPQRAFIAQEKEKRRRLKPGTLVMGSCQFVGQETDVSLQTHN